MAVIKKSLPSKEFLDQCMSYNPNTGKLIWKTRPDCHFKDDHVAMLRNERFAGSEAGWLNETSGYMYVSINRITYKAHRLIFVMAYGVEPEDEVDHINGIKTDNRICNLRSATKSENQKNSKIRVDNTTLFKNVTYHKRHQKYYARCTMNRKRIHIGCYDSPEEAYAAYAAFAKANYGEFARI